MATEKEDPKTKEKKQPKIEIRDLKAIKDIKGGARSSGGSEKRPPGGTAEIDFMNW
ncbi:MAG: hypothetical protein ABI016_15645 [Chthoniobacterales bacterium]